VSLISTVKAISLFAAAIFLVASAAVISLAISKSASGSATFLALLEFSSGPKRSFKVRNSRVANSGAILLSSIGCQAKSFSESSIGTS
jgi:hypothetical protein